MIFPVEQEIVLFAEYKVFCNGGEAYPKLFYMNLSPIYSDSNQLAKDDQAVLSILEEIERNPETSQRKLASDLGIALGLVNSLLKRVISKGYVKMSRLNRKNVRYLLTSKGIYQKSHLTYRYLKSSISFVWRYRQKVHELLEPLANNGHKKVTIYGSGEEAELSSLAIQELGMKIEAIVDPQKANQKCLGHTIKDLDWLSAQDTIEILLVLFGKNNEDNELDEYFKNNACVIENKLEVLL